MAKYNKQLDSSYYQGLSFIFTDTYCKTLQLSSELVGPLVHTLSLWGRVMHSLHKINNKFHNIYTYSNNKDKNNRITL